MKLLCLLILIAMTHSVHGQSLNGADSLQLANKFNELTEKWKDAYNSKNALELAPLYTTDAQYISSHVPGLVARGRDNLIAYFQNGINMGGHIDSLKILTINVSCELATLLCQYQATNSGQTVTGRNLVVLKKTDGRWLIIIHMTVV